MRSREYKMTAKSFRQNMHILDRGLRLAVGIALCWVALPSLDILGDTVFRYILFILGALNIVAAIIGWCAPYHLLGISTREQASEDN